MEITKALCLSTAHIEPETAKWLDGEPSTTWNETPMVHELPFTVWRSEYGWFMYAHIITERDGDLIVPPDLLACLGAALAARCDFLRLDADGPTVRELPDYSDKWGGA